MILSIGILFIFTLLSIFFNSIAHLKNTDKHQIIFSKGDSLNYLYLDGEKITEYNKPPIELLK